MLKFVFSVLFVLFVIATQAQEPTEAVSPVDCIHCSSSKTTTSIQPIDTQFLPPDFGKWPEELEESCQQARDPNYISKVIGQSKFQSLQKDWAEYNKGIKDRISINSQNINTSNDLVLGENSRKFIDNLGNLQTFIAVVDQMDKSGYMQLLKSDPIFKTMAGTQEFLQTLRDLSAEEVTDPKLQALFSKPDFIQKFSLVQAELKKPEVMLSLDDMVKNDLSVLDAAPRAQAQTLYKTLTAKDADLISKIKSGKDVLIREITYPRAQSGTFVDAYKSLVRDDTENYLSQHVPSDDEIKKAFPTKKFTEAELANIRSAAAPVDKNAADEWILPLHRNRPDAEVDLYGKKVKINEQQMQAIDTVARTIWGEASMCGDSTAQMEAVARVMADRAMAVQRGMDEKVIVDKKNKDTLEKLNKNFVDAISDQQIRNLKILTTKFQGLHEFGRVEATDLLPTAQVTSRPDQFSVWHSYSVQRIPMSFSNPNIPAVTIEVKGPQNLNDTSALMGAVCPDREKYRKKWDRVVQLATHMVVDTEDFVRKHQWDPPTKNLLFYTHGPNLPWAQEVSIKQMKITGSDGKAKIVPLRSNSGNSCDLFRTFVPKNGGLY